MLDGYVVGRGENAVSGYPQPLFELTCLDCRTLTQVVVDFGGPPRDTEMAVTCDACKRVHWLTFAVSESETGTHVVVDLDEGSVDA